MKPYIIATSDRGATPVDRIHARNHMSGIVTYLEAGWDEVILVDGDRRVSYRLARGDDQ